MEINWRTAGLSVFPAHDFNFDHSFFKDSAGASPYRYGALFTTNKFPQPEQADEDLKTLGFAMHRDSVADSCIPAGYTYLGQFIDHDISLDPLSRKFPQGTLSPASLENLRSPFLNLDILYGNNHLEDASIYDENNPALLKLGKTETSMTGNMNKSYPNDLPRNPADGIAYVKDARQDENLVIAQTHVAFIKFHNAIVRALGENTNGVFEEAKKKVVQHYQWIVLHDYLPRVIRRSVWRAVLENGNRFYLPEDKTRPFIPVEFSVAAFRFGHSMIRNEYEWNRIFESDGPKGKATLDGLFKFTGRAGLGNNPFPGTKKRTQIPGFWMIDWTRFYDFTGIKGVENNPKRNFAARLGTSLATPLKYITMSPNAIVPGTPEYENRYQFSLANMDLFRGRMFGLPTGQQAAALLEIKEEDKLSADEISNGMPDEVKGAFAEATPLWYYILKEAEIKESGCRLGEVGSRLVAETFIKLLELSPHSILESGFTPEFGHEEQNHLIFGMPDLLKFVYDNCPDDFNELTPV